MRILLAHNSLYFPSWGGGDKSNRLLMEALAARGHQVRVVSRLERFGADEAADLLASLRERSIAAELHASGAVHFNKAGVEVHTLAENPDLRAYFGRQLAAFDPDVIITSTDDPGQLLFDLAVRSPRARVVHLVRATIAVPFGPDASSLNATKTEYLAHADAIVGVSEYVARYVRKYGQLSAVYVPISLLEAGPEPECVGSFDNPFVTMVNPCSVKGISIFLALADACPEITFAAVPTWGANPDDLAELEARANIALLQPFDNVADLMRQTRVLLVPSVWAEARSRVVVEAMSHAVPVVASNAGGIPEAQMGVGYSIPVELIRHYKPTLDASLVPVAEVPPQNVEPWREAVTRLCTDCEHWNTIASHSRAAALEYARGLNVEPFESLLNAVLAKPKKAAPSPAMSDDKRRLLAVLLKKKAASAWFSEEPSGTAPLLFCFPWAGAGTAAYRIWRDLLPIVGVRLPGRESRMSEQPYETMDALLSALGPAMLPYLNASRPFAFFGHSMGAGIAFELARWLRDRHAPLPYALVISAAKAPQLRSIPASQAELTDEELIDLIASGDAQAVHALQNPELRRALLPAFRADTRLYRYHRFAEGEPLPLPMFAYGGTADTRVNAADLAGWGEHTSSSFVQRAFEGGHLYLTADVASVLKQDLAAALTRSHHAGS
ncbi:MAG TPA: thioesterase domain-containing protein [Bryobacteraceae bacterium]|nr:thioesterase domain-containing protein [Bryobacteraceae bacterium]